MKRWYTTASALLLCTACSTSFESEENTVALAPREPAVAQQPVVFTEDKETITPLSQWAHSHDYSSLYDGYQCQYWIREPQSPSHNPSVVVLMGEAKELLYMDKACLEHWIVYIPSRPQMNYQLIAEGDFWAMLDQASSQHSAIGQLPTILVGQGKAADIALSFANNYRSRFSAVVIEGTLSRVNYPNLDTFPLVALREDVQTGPWTSSHVVHRLQGRDNPYAAVLDGDIPDAVDFLAQQLDQIPPSQSYQFRDYRYAQAWPWLRVTSKNNEKHVAQIEAHFDGDTLFLDGKNVASVDIMRGAQSRFPSHVTRVRFNGDLYLLPKSDPVIAIGNEDYPPELRRKADSPSSLANFYRSEPLVIVYQDNGQSAAFLAASKNLAKSLSQLHFKGFPPLNVSLPLVPLSAYQPSFHGKHRAIYVGTPEPFIPLVETYGNDYPIQWQEDQLILARKRTDIEIKDPDTMSYGLTVVPDDNSSLKIALILAAKDLQGLQTLTQTYTNATCLLDDEDLRLWVKDGQYYELALQHSFDSYWGNTQIPSDETVIPALPDEYWEAILAEWLLEESQNSSRVGESLVNRNSPSPEALCQDSLNRFIPDRSFARLVVNDQASIDALNQMLADNPSLEIHDCEALLSYSQGDSPRFDLDHLYSERVLIVDASAIEALPPSTLRQLDYELLPRSLHEIVEKKMQDFGPRFGRELLRTAQTLYPPEEVIR